MATKVLTTPREGSFETCYYKSSHAVRDMDGKELDLGARLAGATGNYCGLSGLRRSGKRRPIALGHRQTSQAKGVTDRVNAPAWGRKA
jgi:hypothetical protein